MVTVNPGSSFEKSPRTLAYNTRYKFWQHFKAFITPIILYQFQNDPFCLTVLYDILFYFMHVYIAPGNLLPLLSYGSKRLTENFDQFMTIKTFSK